MEIRRIDDAAHRRVADADAVPASRFSPIARKADLDANRGWWQPRFQDAASGLLVINIQSFLIRQNGLTILVDSCSGNDKNSRERPVFRRAQWPWLQTLSRSRREARRHDLVICSHLHIDHVGWNTRLDNGRWAPTFPNACYLLAAASSITGSRPARRR